MSTESTVTALGSVVNTTGGVAGAGSLYGITPGQTTYWVSANRTDTYTPDGSYYCPFKTMSAAFSAMVANGNYCVHVDPSSIYADTGTLSTPSGASVAIYGNGSTWTVTGSITLNGTTFVYDLNTIATTVTYSDASGARSERHGGSITGNVVIAAGCYVHMYGVNLSGASYTTTISGTLGGEFVTGSHQIVSGGSSAAIFLYNINMSRASGYNFDMTNGGLLTLSGAFLSTASATYNIYAPTANTLATSHGVQAIVFLSGTGFYGGATTYFYWDNLSIPPTGAYGMGLYAVGATAAYPRATWYANTVASAASTSLTLNTQSSSGNLQVGGATKFFWNATQFSPPSANTASLGTSAYDWNTVYARQVTSNGTSGVAISGSTDGTSAASGKVGEQISSIVASGSAVTLTTATPANVTSISLTAGDWDVEGLVNFVGNSVTIAAGASFKVGTNTTSATLPTDGSEVWVGPSAVTATSCKFGENIQRKFITVSATTTVYLVALGTFTAGSLSAYGVINARRMR